ncbi:MAG: histidinol phosphate phosphatase domain-containing protein [Candidatus Bathyarchaeota archaeon]
MERKFQNKIEIRRIDLHTHSLLSDGELLPSEIVRYAEFLDYEAIAVTDHVDASNIDSVLPKLIKASNELKKFSAKSKFFIGVELTHIPPERIQSMALKAKKLGAELVIVHGETIKEPVKAGTNHEAVKCGDVDVLAHPGLISFEDTELARENNVYLELTLRKGHCLTNGYLAKVALKTGAKLLLNTDLHSPEDFITSEEAFKAAMGAGLCEKDILKVLRENPRKLLKKCEIT